MLVINLWSKIQNYLISSYVYAETMVAPSPDDTDGEDAIAAIEENIRKIMIADQDEDLLTVVVGLLNLAIKFVGLLAVAFLIWGGVKYITSGGDEGKTEEATKTIVNALVGLGIVLISGVVVNFVINAISRELS